MLCNPYCYMCKCRTWRADSQSAGAGAGKEASKGGGRAFGEGEAGSGGGQGVAGSAGCRSDEESWTTGTCTHIHISHSCCFHYNISSFLMATTRIHHTIKHLGCFFLTLWWKCWIEYLITKPMSLLLYICYSTNQQCFFSLILIQWSVQILTHNSFQIWKVAILTVL